VPSEGQRFVVGLVRGLHGLQGAVRVEPLSDDPARFEPGSRLYLEGSDRALTVEWAQVNAPGLLVRFREVSTREAADTLRNAYLEAVRPSAPLDAGAYWWHELVGVPVVSEQGEALGTVEDVFRAGGGEVYVVGGGPRGELLIPAVGAVFREFAPREGRVVVDAEALGLEPVRPRRPRGRRSSRQAPVPADDRLSEGAPDAGGPHCLPGVATRAGSDAGSGADSRS
jgi:16S rRNA processing protein RimM